MKVVEIIPSLNDVGGGSTLFVSLCKEFVASYSKEIDLTIIILYARNEISYYHEIDELGVPVYYIGKKPGYDKRSYEKLSETLEQIKPDVIHSHLDTSVSLLGACKLKKKYTIVHSMHNMVYDSFKKEKLNVYLAKKKWLQLVGVSKKVSSRIEEKTGLKTITAENGIYYDNFLNDVSIKDRKNDFLCVASFSPVKNHQFILKAFKELNDKSLKLTLVGDGQLIEQYKKMVIDLDINEQVTFVGKVENVFDYMKDSKILLLGSTSEANPLVINEAFASGMYVIASNVGGIPDLVVPGVNGDLVEVNNVSQLAKTMKDRISNIDFLEKQRQINKENISQYSIKNCAKKYFDLFVDITK